MVRRVISKALRVQPGDQVIVRAALTGEQKLGRLFVFARETTEERFSPYVQGMYNEFASREPTMHKPMMLRLIEQMPERELSFVADIDGYVCICQELDTLLDPHAKVRMKRIISQHLGWKARAQRTISRIFQWPQKILT